MISKIHILALILLFAAVAAFGQQPDMKKYIALFEAAKEGDLETVKTLVEQGMEVNALISLGATAAYVSYQSLLGAAADSGNLQLVQFLIERGADVNLNPPEGGRMGHPLFFAVHNNDVPMTRLLSSSGASATAKREANFYITKSEMWNCSAEEHIDRSEALKALIQAGAEINQEDGLGRTPIVYARWRGHKDYAEILHRAGAKEAPTELLAGEFLNNQATWAKTGVGKDSYNADYTGYIFAGPQDPYPTAQFWYLIHAKTEDAQGRIEYLVRVIYAPTNFWCCRLRFSQDGKMREVDALGQNVLKFPKEINPQSVLYGVAYRR